MRLATNVILQKRSTIYVAVDAIFGQKANNSGKMNWSSIYSKRMNDEETSITPAIWLCKLFKLDAAIAIYVHLLVVRVK